MPGDDEVIVDEVLPPWGGPDVPSRKIYVDNVAVTIVAQRVEYLDEYGKLVTESLRDFSKNRLRSHFTSLDDFLTRWRSVERKQAIIDELEQAGVSLDALGLTLG